MGVYDYHHDSGRSDRPEEQSDAPFIEHAQKMLTVSPYKAYVEVVADFSSDGRMKPWTRSSAVDPNGKQSLKFMNLGVLIDKNVESAKMSYGVLMIGINTRICGA